jgi:hypothetical protein
VASYWLSNGFEVALKWLQSGVEMALKKWLWCGFEGFKVASINEVQRL